jgi:ubiquinone biosynthesis protein Coq4
LTLRLPNFKWRRDAILAHDLHHLLVGYPCNLWGEMRMAAWEFGAGRMPHLGARLFCVPLVTIGLVRSPRSVLAAFLAGRRSQSLHEAADVEQLLDAPLSAARAKLATCRNSSGGWRNYGRFALLVLESSVVLVLPLGVVGAAIAMLV